jgi:hypothetical protein
MDVLVLAGSDILPAFSRSGSSFTLSRLSGLSLSRSRFEHTIVFGLYPSCGALFENCLVLSEGLQASCGGLSLAGTPSAQGA